MVFKDEWLKKHEHYNVSDQTIKNMVSIAFPNEKLSSYEIIPGGCINLNIKINLIGGSSYVLRLYLREVDAAFKEQKAATLMKSLVPAPEVYFIDDVENIRFAITQYIEGVRLKEVLLTYDLFDIKKIMLDVGKTLTKINSHVFPVSGHLDKKLKVYEKISRDDYVRFGTDCLKKSIIEETFGSDLVTKVYTYLEKYNSFLPDEKQNHFVHADYEPSNILVIRENDQWSISGILDWEFAFSGSIISDVAYMLRYAHKMPLAFEEGFLRGLKEGGIELDEHWRISANMINLLSMLDCLTRCSAENTKQHKDICELIYYFMDRLDQN